MLNQGQTLRPLIEKRIRKNGIVASVALSTVMLIAAKAHATIYTYDANTATPTVADDGSGLGWNTTSVNWLPSGGTDVVWDNAFTDTAIFGANNGAAGKVTVGTVNAGTIQFNAAGSGTYTLGSAASSGNITLGGTAAVVTTLAAGVTSTINSTVSGTAGLNITGSGGYVTLAGSNNYSGITTINNLGRVTITNASALGASGTASASSLGSDYTVIDSGSALSLQLTSGTTLNEAILVNGSGVGGSSGAIHPSTPGTTLASMIQLGSNSTAGFSNAQLNISGNIDLNGFTLTNLNAGLASGSGADLWSGVISSSTGTGGNLILSGGQTILTGANTYYGTTTISSGTLAVGSTSTTNNVLANTPSIAVSSGSNLSLISATASSSNLGLMNANVNISVAAVNAISLNISGSTENIGEFIINGVVQPIGTYSLAGGTGANATADESYFSSGSSGFINVTAAPEPASLSVLALGGLALMRRRGKLSAALVAV